MCEYCQTSTWDYTKELIGECRQGLFDRVIFQLCVSDGNLVMYVDRLGGSDSCFQAIKQINYCPMCGRKLSDE